MFTTGKLMGAGGFGGAIEISYITSSNYGASTGGTLTMPSCQDGDILLVLQAANGPASGGSIPTARYGTGFTSITTQGMVTSGRGTTGSRICASYKVAVAADSGAAKTGFMNDTNEWAIVYVYRPTYTVSSVNILDVEGGATALNPPALTANCSASSYPTISAAAARGGVGTVWSVTLSSTTPTADASYTGMFALGQNPTATDFVSDASDAGTANIYFSFYLELQG